MRRTRTASKVSPVSRKRAVEKSVRTLLGITVKDIASMKRDELYRLWSSLETVIVLLQAIIYRPAKES